ncbi:MAG: glycoside hydrolase family 43 protein, partial [Lentisphaerae bacterium]|nr:glycoside hydrolase family 43 protein [Lentisphaerota bacterium]
MKFRNPILPGFYPDPSICRVGEDYYLVTSSFEYFPGLPIFHSRDLVHWRQLGHVIDRPSQLCLDGLQSSKGLYAPTIRYHNGTFYVINTLVPNAENPVPPYGNFIVTAT